ncbi:hypothetical protein [Brevibacterium linens]|uniref:hypothetical protein n=1 Tax=Brevibacterium linens TaxID=1703 RepID=UPI001C60FB02
MPQTSLIRFVAWRILAVLPVLAVIAVVTFTLSRLAPGNPAALMLGEGASQDQIDHLTKEWGLDQPVIIQLGLWLLNLLSLDPPIRLMARGSLGFECERGARAGSSVPVSHRSLPHR